MDAGGLRAGGDFAARLHVRASAHHNRGDVLLRKPNTHKKTFGFTLASKSCVAFKVR